jgi:hypothetical protein
MDGGVYDVGQNTTSTQMEQTTNQFPAIKKLTNSSQSQLSSAED